MSDRRKPNARWPSASEGRREQITAALCGRAIKQAFEMVVSADDIPVGKPDPAIYLHTLKLLNARRPRPALIRAGNCLVIEDSRAGIHSAKAAGMRVLALATTSPPSQLTEADLVVPVWDEIALDDLGRRLWS